MAGHLDLFPYADPRKGQAEFLADAREAIASGDIMLAQAPTGLGKTAVALASALECALEERKKVFFTTSRRSQHRIAVETLRRIREVTPLTAVDIIAREAMCSDHSRHSDRARSGLKAVSQVLTDDVLHVQEVIELARRFGVCPHLVALRAAKAADVLVCDYNYLFSRQREAVLRVLGLDLAECVVIIDEAHNLPSRARESLSGRISADTLSELAEFCSEELAGSLRAISRVLGAEANVVGGESKVPEDFLSRLLRHSGGSKSDPLRAETVAEALEETVTGVPSPIRPAVDEFQMVLREWQHSDRLRLLSPSRGGSLLLTALDPRSLTRTVLQDIHAGLLMSGTLHPGEMYVDILGIPRERCVIRSYPPNFPPENRLLVASQRVSSSYRGRPDSYRVFAQEIYDLCFSIPGNFAAFFPSYDIARRVGEILYRLEPPKTLLWERRGQTKAEKEGLVRVLSLDREGRGHLLIAVQGASLSEGMDYPGNILSGVIVAGLAIKPPELKVEALRAFYARLFGRRSAYEYAYLYPALNKLVQCAGRCIRSPEDVATVVVLDNRLLRPFYRSRLPVGFELETPSDLVERVRTFFYTRLDEKGGVDQEGRRGHPEPHRLAGQEGGGEMEGFQGLPPHQSR